MIALVGLNLPAGPAPGVARIDRLPAPEAALHLGYLVRCDDERTLTATLSWYEAARASRPSLVLGIVCAPEVCAEPLGRTTVPVSPVVAPGDLESDRVPTWALAELRANTIEARPLDELYTELALQVDRPLLEALVPHAIRGGRLKSLARALGLSDDTIRRRLGPIGQSPGALMSSLRLRAYDLLLESEHTPKAALAACGWRDARAYQKARSRRRNDEGSGCGISGVSVRFLGG
jgi:AraC-like DNA-binding protein